MNEFRADLHCHSTFSDGTDTPTQLIELAIANGLLGLSITDHDTIAAYGEAFEVARSKQFRLLNGVEFSASYRGEPVHILGYAYHMQSEAIKGLCMRHTQRREKRNLKILEKLKGLGITIEPAELHHQGTWGRPHIAHALLTRGLVKSIQEAFEVYLAEGKVAYDPGEPISVEETLEIIHQGKGKAVLAHPHLLKRSTTIRAMLSLPFDGLECYYARFGPAQEKKWIDLAQQRKWLITGGSDYHGSIKPHNALGTSWVPRETFDLLYTHFLENNHDTT
ncbi:PHP domain-containing protein [Chlamydiota bacterium]